MLCVIRGGGDLATGVAWRLTRAGLAVVVTELPEPLTVRRSVALSTAVTSGSIDIEGMVGQLTTTPAEATEVSLSGAVGVLVSPGLPEIEADVVVDARLAKRNIDTTIADAPLVIGLGPGFTVGTDCHSVIETQRGHHLGRVLSTGSAVPNTGTPGVVGGRGAERVLRAPSAGTVRWTSAIGDVVLDGALLGHVGSAPVVAPFDGLVRGLIADGAVVPANLKIGDVDPRSDRAMCHEISDKALAIGGGVVEAVLSWAR
ncbi:MAG: selenium-dependent molybdenum cofactor biosynthesis protein YqeB [Acidimicrobiia bacterium]|nr:selenium-dependent molybdenum cofactor biosynthesis protein YqeB [Acidimicrobiia bacterium]